LYVVVAKKGTSQAPSGDRSSEGTTINTSESRGNTGSSLSGTTVTREIELYPNTERVNVRLAESVIAEAASSPLGEKVPGGIDLNPNNLKLQVQGQEIKIDFSINLLQTLESMTFDGFLPVIINVAPITNIPLLLGESSIKENRELGYLP